MKKKQYKKSDFSPENMAPALCGVHLEKQITKKKKKKCKHNGGKGYWNTLPGFICLLCGKEVNKKTIEQTMMDDLYAQAIEKARDANQTVGEKKDYYITIKQLLDIINGFTE